MIGRPFYTINSFIRGTFSTGGRTPLSSLSYYAKKQEDIPPTPPTPPTPTSGVEDISAYINALPILFLYANISGYASTYQDVSASIRCVIQSSTSLYSSLRVIARGSTEPLNYVDIILATKKGISIISKQTTLLPDITAEVYGWDYLDLGGKIKVFGRTYENLYGLIQGWDSSYADISASLVSMYISDINASLEGVPSQDLLADIVSIEFRNLIGIVTGYAPRDLYALCGAVPPVPISAYVNINQPKDLGGYIIGGFSGVESLFSDVVATGALTNLYAFIRPFRAYYSDIFTDLTVRMTRNLVGYITGWAEAEITAYIRGWGGGDIIATIWPVYLNNSLDLDAFIRVSYEGESSVKTFIHGWISTHTSDKAYNLHLIRKPPKKIVLGMRRGLVIMEMEPIYGYFPDLHATINAISLFTSDIPTFIRVNQRETLDLSTIANPVSKYVALSSVAINLVNLVNLNAEISAFSGFRDIRTYIVGSISASTSTSADAGWVYKSLSVRFIFGTSGGLFIPSLSLSRIRTDIFINSSDTPDLWGYIRGWDSSDLYAYINITPYSNLAASLVALDLSHTSYISAVLYPTRYVELLASISGIGSFVSLYASIVPSGRVVDLGASIYPYLVSAGYRIVRIDTKPYSNLYASINYNEIYGMGSGYKDLEAFIRCSDTYNSYSDLLVSIESSTDIRALEASITGRKVSRIRTLRFIFRPLNRQTCDFYSLINGIKEDAYSNIFASIYGDYLTSDLAATIYPVYYRVHASEPDVIKVYKQSGQFSTLYKKLKLSLHSKTDSYIYDSIQRAIYSMSDDTWVLKLSELSETGDFYDKSEDDREKLVSDISEYASVDEAIRAAIVWLSDRNSVNMYASISSIGYVLPFYADIFGRRLDTQKDIITKIVSVGNDPIIYAEIVGVI